MLAVWRDISLLWLIFLGLVMLLPLCVAFFYAIKGLAPYEDQVLPTPGPAKGPACRGQDGRDQPVRNSSHHHYQERGRPGERHCPNGL